MIPIGHRGIVDKHYLLRERVDISQFTPVKEINMLGVASPFDASEDAIAYRCFRRRQGFQICDWRSQVLKRVEKGEAFEDLHNGGKRFEAKENTDMYRVLPWSGLAM